MQIDCDLYQDCQIIFHRDLEYSYANEIEILQEKQRLGVSCDNQRTSHQMDQIMHIFKYQSPLLKPKAYEDQFQSICSLDLGQDQTIPKPIFLKREKKIKKGANSRFHNYQKHLNNALKKMISVPKPSQKDTTQHNIAYSIWTTFCTSEIKTKRILHFIFNQQNEHRINEPQLKTYNLSPIYRTYSPEIISQAKNYLTQIAIQQLQNNHLDHYLATTKIKNKEGFKDYLLEFRNQLETGFLKRRISSEKILN